VHCARNFGRQIRVGSIPHRPPEKIVSPCPNPQYPEGSIMVKVFVLLLSLLLASASAGGYFYIDEKIIAGEGKVAEGQKEFDEGLPALEKGKAKLEAGKLELAEGKAEYEKAHDNAFMVFMDNVFNSGEGFSEGRKQIAEGDKQVAQGEAKIIAGEKRLAAGELKLDRGKEQLDMARVALLACALSTVFFGVLSLALAILWRKSLVKTYKHVVS
jgi:hypothetical protein